MNKIGQKQTIKTNVERLEEISSKESRIILGTMSGTSMDGLDLALCRIQGHGMETSLDVLNFLTVEHTPAYKKKIRTVFAHEDADVVKLAVLDQYVAEVTSEQILGALDKWNLNGWDVDLIANHGQTVFHCPGANPFQEVILRHVTLQLGDGDFIAGRTGIITVSDFRQKHIAAGGEGAPLALYGDLLLFSVPDESRILLNIGGIANFTWLPRAGFQEAPLSTDTGPGNTMLDAFIQKHYGMSFDKDACIGQTGQVDGTLLSALKNDPFFGRPIPRTTGPELFNLDYLAEKLVVARKKVLANKDIMATLYAFTADTITAAVKPFLRKSTKIFISGGGIHNPLLMKLLKNSLSEFDLRTTLELGVDPDAKEAIIFAMLANECLFGKPEEYPDLGRGYPKTCMGKVSFVR